jgi:CheY-like chemotaxis protein
MSEASKPSRTTILVVEDQGDLRSIYRRQLKERGYCVMTAEDDEEALERVECLHCDLPALILTDLQLPTINGLIKKVSEHGRLREVPIVALIWDYTGHVHEGVQVLEGYEQLDDLLMSSQSKVEEL